MDQLTDDAAARPAEGDRPEGRSPLTTSGGPIRDVADIVEHWGRTAPDKVALTQAGSSTTYQALDRVSNQIAHALIASGAGASRVGYLGKNDERFFWLWFGASKAGSAIAPLNWRYTPVEIARLIDDAQPPVVLVSSEFVDVASQAQELARHAFEVVVFTSDDDPDGLDAWVERQPVTAPEVERLQSATALLAYTSGTTGRPKGVQLSQAAFSNSFRAAEAEPSLTWRSDDVGLMVMPAFHLAGSWVSLQALYHGATLAVLPAFEVTSLARAVVDQGVTIVCMVPAAVQMLLQHASTVDVDLSSLRRIIYAGSPISADTLRSALDVFGCDLVQFYGATELWIVTLLRPEQHMPDQPEILTSCGSPVAYAEVRVVDLDGSDITDGSVGELLVRTPTMFSGYWNRPEATAEALVEGGWYRTGDLGRRDAAGCYYLIDRVKDMIVSGGENIYSVEVERALSEHPAVASAAVVGAPDPKWGEKVTAFVVLQADHQVTEAELQDHCRSLIARYKVPKSIGGFRRSSQRGLATVASALRRRVCVRQGSFLVGC